MGGHVLNEVCVSSQFLSEVFRSCQELGARKPVLLSALNLTDAELRDPRNQFSANFITTLYRTTTQELEREDIFLDMGRGIFPTGFADIGYAARFEETVGGVIQAAAAAIDSGFNKPLLRWEQSVSSCRLVINPDCKISNDLVSIIFAALAHFTDSVIGSARPSGRMKHDHPNGIKAACFKSRRPRHFDGLICLPGDPPVSFGQSETSLEWHRDVISLPNPCANREVAQAVHSHSNRHLADGNDPSSLSRLSYIYLFPLLDRSGLSIDAAAETFGMAERTLRRKLAAEGASFRQILEQVRRNTCQLYFLEGTRSLSEIATKLGYSELSAFTRAYTAWYGRSPSQDMVAQDMVAPDMLARTAVAA